MMPPNHAGRARGHALVALFASAVMFSVMGAATKWATRPVPGQPALSGPELASFRYLFGLLFVGMAALPRRVSLLGEDRRGLLWRGIYGGIASTAYFFGLQHTSLMNATLLNYTFVIWGPLIAVFVLGERLGWRGVLAVAAALLGTFLITNPKVGHIHLGDVVALLSGVMAGAAIVQIRRLRQAESSYAVFFYFNLIGIPISLTVLSLTGTHFVLPSLAQAPVVVTIGFSSFAAQLLMTYGFKEMTAAQGSLITLTAILYTAALDWALFREPLPPIKLLGGALILFSAIVMTVRPTQRLLETSAE